MRKLTLALFLVFSLTALPAADHAYEGIASAHDLMDYVVKPSMDRLVAINKAGGPQSEKDWKHAKAHASILAETSQLLLMAGRDASAGWLGDTAVDFAAKIGPVASRRARYNLGEFSALRRRLNGRESVPAATLFLVLFVRVGLRFEGRR